MYQYALALPRLAIASHMICICFVLRRSSVIEDEIFPSGQDLGPRNWGREELLVLVSGKFSMKRLTLRAGQRGGLQFHHLKDEAAVVVSGELLVRFDSGDGVLRERILFPGDCLHFPPGLIHQEEAITDCVLIEASTPHFNDRVRVEGAYGLVDTSGLPSTSRAEVVER